MKADTIPDAEKNASLSLNKFTTSKNFSDLEKAIDLNNTDSSIIFEYLNFLKKNKEHLYSDELKKYKFFLDKESSAKLGVKYIDHKDDFFKMIDLIKNIELEKVEISVIQESLKKELEKCYSKEDKEIIDQKSDKRINNLPLHNLENDIVFYLTMKIVFGRHLHTLADFLFDDKDDEKKESEIKYFKNSLSYLKIISEILKYNLSKNEKMLAFNLINILDLVDYYSGDEQSLARLNYFLSDMKLDNEQTKKMAGDLYSSLIAYNQSYNFIIKNFMNDYKILFFETLENILKSKCIRQLVGKLKNHNKDNDNIISNDKNYNNYLSYIKKNIIFFPFFRKNAFGLTITLNGKVIINDEYRTVELVSLNGAKLFNFCVWIVTGIHEVIGHFLKDYFYYLTRFIISEESGSSDESSNDSLEGGNIVEEYLFPNIKELYLCDILYILDITNWNKNSDDFSKFFSSNERKEIIEKGIKQNYISSLSKELINFLSKFGINKNDLYSYQTHISIRCKKFNAEPVIELSKRICLSHRKKNGK